jgi:hypothetical protein
MSSEEEEDVGFIEAEEIESDFDPECDHDWEYGQCINCGQIHEPRL